MTNEETDQQREERERKEEEENRLRQEQEEKDRNTQSSSGNQPPTEADKIRLGNRLYQNETVGRLLQMLESNPNLEQGLRGLVTVGVAGLLKASV